VPDDQDARAKAVQLYTTSDLSATDIAEQLGISRGTLYNWLNAAGVSGRRASSHPEAEMGDVLRCVGELRGDIAANRDRMVALEVQVARLVGLIEGFVSGSQRRNND
jgi:transposase-like protein